MYPPQHAGGYELIWQGTVRSLRARGHNVRVLASDLVLNDAADSEPDVFRELRRYWNGDAQLELGPLARLRIELENAAILKRHLEQFRPDVVSLWSMGGISMSLIEHVRRRGLPGVGFVADHWLASDKPMDLWLRAWMNRPRVARLITTLTGVPTTADPGRAAVWHFISEATRQSALGGPWKLPLTEVTCAGIAADQFPFRPRADDWQWRLAYVGRVDPVKGVDTALLALAQLPDLATLKITGASPNRSYLRELHALRDRLGLTQRVSFSQTTRELLADVYADADAVLFPVRWDEPWGLVPLEAMAVGSPVIATGMGGSAEYLRHGDNCLLFAPDDEAALAHAVHKLAEHPSLRDHLRRVGRETAMMHTEDAFNEAFCEALERAAA